MASMDAFLSVAKALSDPTRVRALLALRKGELCLCQLIDLLQLAPSTISKHMSLLHSAGLVEQRKEGRWRFFRLPSSPTQPVRGALAWASEALEESDRVKKDTRRVRSILKKDKNLLCRYYIR